jgi:NitT/TauT family transport system substrate-binding protein
MSAIKPESTVWYIEARAKGTSADKPADSSGSGVVIRLKKTGDVGPGRRYLLTCAHVVLHRPEVGAAGYGAVLDTIQVWRPGGAYSPGQAKTAKVASVIRPIDRASVPLELQSPATDWVILDIEDPTFRASAHHAGISIDPAPDTIMIIGYPGGTLSFDAGVVGPTSSGEFSFKGFDGPTAEVVGSETRPGMSGGAWFDGEGGLVGIHRSRTDATIECLAVSTKHIVHELHAVGYEVVAGPPSTPTPTRRLVLEAAVGAVASAAPLALYQSYWWKWPRPPISGRTPIRIGIKDWPGYAPLVVAAKLKLCPTLDISFHEVDDISDAKNKITSGKINVGMWLAATHVVNRADRNDSKVVLKLDDSFKADGIVARVSITKINHLVGKNVIYQKHDAGHCLLHALCDQAGININQLNLLDSVPPKDVPKRFAEDATIAAATTYEDHLSDTLKLAEGSHILALAEEIVDRNFGIIDVLAVSNDLLKSGKAAVGSLISGWYQAVHKLKTGDKDAIKIACEFLGNVKYATEKTYTSSSISTEHFMKLIDDKCIKLAGPKENLEFFSRTNNSVPTSPFLEHYRYYENKWQRELDSGPKNFYQADGSLDFLHIAENSKHLDIKRS